MGYIITNYSKQKAKDYQVTIKPSKNKKKKIDVYKDDKLIASIGAIGYKDYGKFLESNGKEYADQKRNLYRMRHKKDLNSGNGLWANRILW
jgi:predicted Zn-dependent protease